MNPRWRVLDFLDEARKGKMELLMGIGKIFGLATAAALGASLLIGQASAAPTNGLSAAASQVTNNFQDIRWVCGPYRPYRCWWAGPYYVSSPWWAYGWRWRAIR
jgi:hypothetical protein